MHFSCQALEGEDRCLEEQCSDFPYCSFDLKRRREIVVKLQRGLDSLEHRLKKKGSINPYNDILFNLEAALDICSLRHPDFTPNPQECEWVERCLEWEELYRPKSLTTPCKRGQELRRRWTAFQELSSHSQRVRDTEVSVLIRLLERQGVKADDIHAISSLMFILFQREHGKHWDASPGVEITRIPKFSSLSEIASNLTLRELAEFRTFLCQEKRKFQQAYKLYPPQGEGVYCLLQVSGHNYLGYLSPSDYRISQQPITNKSEMIALYNLASKYECYV